MAIRTSATPCSRALLSWATSRGRCAQAWVDGACSPIASLGVSRPNFGKSGAPFATRHLPLCVRAAALRDSRTLDLYWFLPPLIEQVRCRYVPLHTVTYRYTLDLYWFLPPQTMKLLSKTIIE